MKAERWCHCGDLLEDGERVCDMCVAAGRGPVGVDTPCPEGLNPLGVTCSGCGQPAHGYAGVNDDWYCHCSCRDCYSGAQLPLGASWTSSPRQSPVEPEPESPEQ